MAMALASMNPMVGSAGTKPQIGGMLLSVDKDLKNDGWGSYYVTRGFDSSSFLGIDKNGKLNYKKDKEINECSIDSIYLIKTEDVDEVFDNLLEEAELPYQERPIRNLAYIYEAFTKNHLYTKDQVDQDVLLEKVYLDKLSKIISGEVDNLKNEFKHSKKDVHYPLEEKPNYTQDWDQPDAGIKFPMLAAANIVEKELQAILENKGVVSVE